MISRIIKVEVRVISQSWMLRLITLTSTLNILDITETEVHNNFNCFIIHWMKKMEVMFLLLQWWEAKQRVQTWHNYPWPWVSLTWLLYKLKLWHSGCWFQKFTVCPWPIRKELEIQSITIDVVIFTSNNLISPRPSELILGQLLADISWHLISPCFLFAHFSCLI